MGPAENGVLRDLALKILRPYYFNAVKPIILGVLFLALTREFLFKHRVYDYNTEEALQYKRPEPCGDYCNKCTDRELRFRTHDGHCNNLEQTGMGMKNLRFGRSALKDPKIKDPGLWSPDPYVVAEKLLRPADGKKRADATGIYNLWMTSWINFNLHDWVFHDSLEEDPWYIQAGPDPNDKFRLRKTYRDKEGYTINTQTPWWDASQVYGTSEEQAYTLRVPGRCEMKLDEDGNMPLGTDGIPMAGFNDNWWVGVEILQHLWLKEHNYICGLLRKSHPDYPEDDLYELSRMIVAAQIAKIHTVEWTPALLDNDVMNVSMHNNWIGLSDAFLQYQIRELEKSSIFKKLSIPIKQFLLKQLANKFNGTKGVGQKTELYGTPYSLSEDFVSSYRLHPLMPDEYDIAGDVIPAADMLSEKTRNVIHKHGLSKIVDSWGHLGPTTLTLMNYPRFMTDVTLPEHGRLNMAVVDIVRDRERGMPRYNQARREYGIPPLKTFEDLTDNPEWLAAIKSVYEHVEDIDYLVGCLAESPRPKGYLISDVQFYVFIINASRRLLCDRFYQEAYNEQTYTKEGIKHIADTTFKKVLLRHYPELRESVGNVHNAFYAWKGTPKYGPAAEAFVETS